MNNPIEFRSPESDTILYACRGCRLVGSTYSMSATQAKRAIEECCTCPNCGKEQPGRHRSYCDDCNKIAQQKREAEWHAKALELPVVEDKGEPVYVGDRYYETLDEAIEALLDDGVDLTDVVIHPCVVGQCAVPDLIEFIEERWAEQFDEEVDMFLSKSAIEAINVLTEVLAKEAPVVWQPRMKERIALPVPEPAE